MNEVAFFALTGNVILAKGPLTPPISAAPPLQESEMNRHIESAVQHALLSSDPVNNQRMIASEVFSLNARVEPGIVFPAPPGKRLTAEAQRRMMAIATAPGKAAARRLEQRFAAEPCEIFELIPESES